MSSSPPPPFTSEYSSNVTASIVPTPVSSISAPIDTLQQHFELQLAQLALIEQSLRNHFNSTLSSQPSLNPVTLLTRLRTLQEETLPKLQARQKKLAEERAKVGLEVERLRGRNKELLHDIQTRIESVAVAPALTSPSSSSSTRHQPHSSPVRSSSRSRPSTAPVSASSIPAPSTPVVPRRKSLRPSTAHQPPSPSTIVEAALLEQIQTSSELEGPISEKEFAGVSTTVKSRVKLMDVNHMLNIIQTHFQRYISQHKIKDASSLPPLTLTTLAEEGGVKIGGASSQCIIGTLRACKRILVGKNGTITLVKPPI